MIARRLARDWRAHIGLGLLACVVTFAAAGEIGLAGMALGLVGTGFSIVALWWVVRLTGGLAPLGAAPRFGASLAILAFLAKLPIFIALGLVAQRLGGPAPGCFLLGLGLVYLALVGWALASS
ncbi:MAG TPA: hypothetical protein PLL78_09425 [Fimbriimonadaceae bacterium]|nr:hypothetical protein [Fimbriimonadaceae bacterium]HRJ96894.1 hypothetical protein [Fimbriimonadaceae bacterium]